MIDHDASDARAFFLCVRACVRVLYAAMVQPNEAALLLNKLF